MQVVTIQIETKVSTSTSTLFFLSEKKANCRKYPFYGYCIIIVTNKSKRIQ